MGCGHVIWHLAIKYPTATSSDISPLQWQRARWIKPSFIYIYIPNLFPDYPDFQTEICIGKPQKLLSTTSLAQPKTRKAERMEQRMWPHGYGDQCSLQEGHYQTCYWLAASGYTKNCKNKDTLQSSFLQVVSHTVANEVPIARETARCEAQQSADMI